MDPTALQFAVQLAGSLFGSWALVIWPVRFVMKKIRTAGI